MADLAEDNRHEYNDGTRANFSSYLYEHLFKICFCTYKLLYVYVIAFCVMYIVYFCFVLYYACC